MSARRPSAGFTLIELLVAFAILSVLLVLAVPSFVSFQRNSELTTSANNLLSALSAARAEAMKRQLPTVVIPASGTNWASGWIVFVDANRNLSAGSVAMDSGDIELIRQPAIPSTVTIDTTNVTGFADGSARYVRFDGSGFITLIGGGFPTGGSGAVDFKSSTGEIRRLIAGSAGRMRVCKPADSGCS